MRQFVQSFKDLLFPPMCISCRQCLVDAKKSGVDLLCHTCCRSLLEDMTGRCRVCGYPRPLVPDSAATVGMPVDSVWTESLNCPECEEVGFGFERIYLVGSYQGRLQELLLQAKASTSGYVGFTLGQLLAGRLVNSDVDQIVAVPMHWRRRLMRNQSPATMIARGLSYKTGIPLNLRMLLARRLTKKQGMLSPRQRIRNVERAFRVRGSRLHTAKHILLVDDVMTTGATLAEISRALQDYGVDQISVAVVCRAGFSVPGLGSES
ncbi:MAG: hypothetical protein CMJ79_11925 [Planctomycetaceae bacterium]|nr:hypothetical protein [Planctomycetaceae bacterium]